MAGEGWWMGFESIDQSSQHQKLNVIQKWGFHFFGWRRVVDGVQVYWPARPIIWSEHNQNMSISFFWLETSGGWGSSPLTSPADHQKLNVIQKVAFHFFWLKRAGRWGLIPLTSPADHQKLNVIQKWAFHFIGWRGVVDGVWVHWPAWLIIQSECNPKMSISFFWLERGGKWGSSPSTSLADHQKWTQSKKKHFILLAGEGWQMGFESIDQPGWSSEVEHNENMSISFYWLERGGRWGLSPSTSPANHQKLNVIQKWAFHFIGWRGVANGVQVHQSARQIIRSERNLKTSISFFLAGEGWWMGFESIDQPGQSSEVEHN